jgi:signal transduction histidine kinase
LLNFRDKKLKIHHYISIIAFLALIPMLFLGVTVSSNLIQRGNELKNQHLSSVSQVEQEINNFLQTHLLAVDTLGKQAGEMNLPPSELREAIVQVTNQYAGFTEIYLDTPDFQVSSRVEAVSDNYRLLKRDQLFLSITPSDFVTLGKPYISPVIKGMAADDTIVIGITIKNSSGAFYGYIMGFLDLTYLQRSVDAHKIYRSGYIVLVDSSGQIMPIPGSGIFLSPQGEQPILETLEAQGNGSLEYYSPLFNRWEIAGFHTVPEYGWGIWVAAARNEVMTPLFRVTGLFSVLIIIGITVILVMRHLLVVSISRPLTALNEACQQFSSGNLNYRVDYQRAGLPVEIDSLGENFNYMAASVQNTTTLLKNHRDDLEERVNERTRELLQKNMELLVEHNTLQAVMNSMNEGLILFDAGAAMIYANPVFVRQFGLQDHDTQGMTYHQMIAYMQGKGFDIPWKELWDDFSSKRSYEPREVRLNVKDKPLYYLLIGFPVVSNEEFIGYGYIIRDITRDKEVENLKDSILSTVSHELRTPLTTIRGCAESLMRKGVKWEKSEKEGFLAAIVDESKHLRELIENIMDMSKIEAGALNLDIHDTDIRKLIDRVVARLEPRLKDGKITVTYANEIPFALIDERRIEQVLSNLIENGIKYSAADADLLIETEFLEKEERIKISVVDHGIGIDPQYHSAIFDRFYRISTPMLNKVRGSGVGLSIAKGIVEAHGGRIWVESKADVGSMFIFTLPCSNIQGG